MEAGFGAEQQASRRSRKLDRLRREQAADDETRADVNAAIARQQQQVRVWAQGAEGERLVARALETLEAYGWTALHDVRWPGRAQANIDHIAIGPGGIVVIDAKNWTGAVALKDGVLRQNGYRRDREVEGVAEAVAAVGAILAPQHRALVHPVICLAGQEEQEAMLSGAGVTVVGLLRLAAHLAALPPRLTPYDVADAGRGFAQRLESSGGVVAAGVSGDGVSVKRSPSRGRSRPARRPTARRRGGESVRSALLKAGLTIAALWLFLQWFQGYMGTLGG